MQDVNVSTLIILPMTKKTIILYIILLTSTWSFSQSNNYDQQVGVSLKASTNGFGGDLYYKPIEKIAIKAGLEYISLNFKSETIERFVGEDVNVSIPTPMGGDIIFNTNAKFKTGALSLAVGYQPFKIMYITAGISKSLFASEVIGVPTTDLDLGSYSLPNSGTVNPRIAKENIGSFNIDINSKNSIMPYIGIGLGSFVPQNKNVSFALELGAYYVGNYSLKYRLPQGLNAESIDYGPNITQEQKDYFSNEINAEVNKAIADLDREVSIAINDINEALESFKFYPVIKLTIGFKAFTFKK